VKKERERETEIFALSFQEKNYNYSKRRFVAFLGVQEKLINFMFLEF